MVIMSRRRASALFLIIAVTLPGCSGGGGARFANENDRLRAQALDLENQAKALKSRNAELEAQLAQATRAPTTLPADVIAATPHVASISLGRLSHARDDNNDGKLDTILLFLEPTDGLGRFLQIVGSVSIHAAILPADGPAKTIGQRNIGPKELRDAYRSSFTGQYYSLSLPIELPSPSPDQCIVKVTFTDGYSGQSFSTDRAIDLK